MAPEGRRTSQRMCWLLKAIWSTFCFPSKASHGCSEGPFWKTTHARASSVSPGGASETWARCSGLWFDALLNWENHTVRGTWKHSTKCFGRLKSSHVAGGWSLKSFKFQVPLFLARRRGCQGNGTSIPRMDDLTSLSPNLVQQTVQLTTKQTASSPKQSVSPR